MAYTIPQLEDILAASKLIKDGLRDKVQQYHPEVGTNPGEWGRFVGDLFIDGKWLYRPKPTPKRVPWSKPEHVPGPVLWIRFGEDGDTVEMVTNITARGIATPQTGLDWVHLDRCKYSTDRKTWKTCEVEA